MDRRTYQLEATTDEARVSETWQVTIDVDSADSEASVLKKLVDQLDRGIDVVLVGEEVSWESNRRIDPESVEQVDDGGSAGRVEWNGHLDESRNREISDEEHVELNELAASLVGRWVRDQEGHAWPVIGFAPTGKDGWATISDGCYWERPDRVTVVEPQPSAAREISDASALDQLQRALNGSRQWNGGDICNELARMLQRSGRVIVPSLE